MLLLPKLQQFAAIAFRTCRTELREELAAEVIGRCYCAYHRLVQLDREDQAHPISLMRFAVKQVGIGLQLGCPRNRCDVSSRYCRLKSGVTVRSLNDRFAESGWQDLAIENRHASPAETAAFRVDFAAWLITLPSRDRKIALLLSTGEETYRVAKRFQLTAHGLDDQGRELECEPANPGAKVPSSFF